MITYTDATAEISACGRYRYRLDRRWLSSAGIGRVCWVMLNPSTADGEKDDPTIRRCVGFAQSWGYAGIAVVNLFAIRSTKPPRRYSEDLVGTDNDGHIMKACLNARLVVCAWGTSPVATERARHVLGLIQTIGCDPHALALTASGAPGHPLFMQSSKKPFSIYSGAAVLRPRGPSTV